MTDRRTYHGVLVSVERGIPTHRGEGARIVLPDGSERIAVPDESHPTIESACSYETNRWRVGKWREQGSEGAI